MRFLNYLLIALLLISRPSFAEIDSLEKAINASSHQAMLTQQMLKDYILIGMSVRSRKAQQELDQAIEQYEAELSMLNAYANTDAYRELLNASQQQWQKVKTLYQQPVSKAQVEVVRQETEVLLQQWNDATLSLVESKETEYGRLISTAGFVRMLAQRVTSHYALQAWGFENKYTEAFITSLEQFEENREVLESSELNSAEIQGELKKIQRDFKRFKGLQTAETNRGILALVTRSGDKIAKSMDMVTARYMFQGLSF